LKSSRKLDWVGVVAWLMLFVFGVALFRMSPRWVFVAVGAFTVLYLLRRGWPSLSRWGRRQVARRALELTVKSPDPRYARSPVRLAELARRLADANLGVVGLKGRSVRLTSPEGDWFELTASDGERVTLPDLSVSSTDPQLAVLACDSLAPVLGPIELGFLGIEMVIDGTQPRADLERELLSRLAEPSPEPVVSGTETTRRSDGRLLN